MRKLFFLAFFIFIFQNVQAENPKLSEAYEVELINRVKSVFSPSPPGIKTIEDRLKKPVCATPIFLEATMVKHRLSPKARSMLNALLSRPKYDPDPEHTYDSPAGHFKIHYTTSGPAAVYAAGVDVNPPDGVPDYVNRCAEFFDYVWTYELDTLGYREPPSDYFYPDSNGGDGKYDVYLDTMDYFGYTVPERKSAPDDPVYTSYIVMLNDFSEWAYLHEDSLDLPRVTAAHEFFHAIQMGYDATEYEYENGRFKSYWMEMSAVWMEDMVYNQVNDYTYYLLSFFNHPEWSLKTFGVLLVDPIDMVLHPYGSCIWPIYLSEKFGEDIIKDIWENCVVPGDNVIDPLPPDGKSATDKALEARGSTFEDAFREFTVWNYFTADRAIPHLFYSEGKQFRRYDTPAMVRVDAVHTEYPVNVTSIPHPPQNLGSNYVVFVPDPHLKEGGVKMDFIGQSGKYKVSAVGYNPGHLVPFDTTFLINPVTQTGIGKVCDWNNYTQVIMIPAVITRSPNDTFVYVYLAEYDSSCHGEGRLPEKDEVLQNFPNPFVIENESDLTYFPFVLSSPSRVRIDILSLSGERIKTIIPEPDVKWGIGEYLDKNLAMPWDGKSENGEYVASGIYLYRFRTDKNTVIKKMAVIR